MVYALGIMTFVVWPVTMMGLAYMFRKQIRSMFFNHHQMKRDEIEFGNQLMEIERQAILAGLIESKSEQPIPYDETHKQLIRISHHSPRAAMREAQYQMEQSVIEAGKRILTEPATGYNDGNILLRFVRDGIITEKEKELYEELKWLDLGYERVIEPNMNLCWLYMLIARRLIRLFSNISVDTEKAKTG